MAHFQPPPYRSAARSIHSSSIWTSSPSASSAPYVPQPAIDQQGVLLAQQAHAHSQQIAWYSEQLQQLSLMIETLSAAVKAVTISQAEDQRRIAEMEVRLQEADSDDDPLSALELFELRRWKQVLCEGETRSLLNRLEEALETERQLRAENERLRAQLSKQ
jgi:hypothetical protein